eukprot:6370776-Ditylum_brightwellii.AAC.1
MEQNGFCERCVTKESSTVHKGKQKWNQVRQDSYLYQLSLDLQAGGDTSHQACSGDWLDWKDGSTLFFWRWPPQYRKEARNALLLGTTAK